VSDQKKGGQIIKLAGSAQTRESTTIVRGSITLRDKQVLPPVPRPRQPLLVSSNTKVARSRQAINMSGLSFVLRLILMCATSFIIITHAFHPTTIPPLLDVPVYSLSTLGGSNGSDGKSTMNILTYATPVGIQPNRIWCISLYKGTLSYDNFIRERQGVLQ
jgi:hypothetical protein